MPCSAWGVGAACTWLGVSSSYASIPAQTDALMNASATRYSSSLDLRKMGLQQHAWACWHVGRKSHMKCILRLICG